jgi:hypothetical protein
MKDEKQTNVRLSGQHLKDLAKIRKCGDFPDDSCALRFCIEFTKTMFSLIPVAVAENYIESLTSISEVPAVNESERAVCAVPDYSEGCRD